MGTEDPVVSKTAWFLPLGSQPRGGQTRRGSPLEEFIKERGVKALCKFTRGWACSHAHSQLSLGTPDPLILSPWIGDKQVPSPISLSWHRPGQLASFISRTIVIF